MVVGVLLIPDGRSGLYLADQSLQVHPRGRPAWPRDITTVPPAQPAPLAPSLWRAAFPMYIIPTYRCDRARHRVRLSALSFLRRLLNAQKNNNFRPNECSNDLRGALLERKKKRTPGPLDARLWPSPDFVLSSALRCVHGGGVPTPSRAERSPRERSIPVRLCG